MIEKNEDKMGLSLRRMCTKKARTRSTEHGSGFITIEKTLSNIKNVEERSIGHCFVFLFVT